MKVSRKLIILIIFTISLHNNFSFSQKPDNSAQISKATQIYQNSDFKEVLDFDLFKDAMIGMNSFEFSTQKKIVIIDYSKPSTEKRFYVIDLEKKKLLYHCLVAHGKNTGENIAKSFSNQPKSLKSCLGFFKTAETYSGKHGYSLKLDGLEKDVNDNARNRAIVIHGADYVSQDFINKYGRLGRSWGCPALPKDLSKDIIDAISGGVCLYIFGESKDYKTKSEIL
jgi:hypothetical protein